MARLPDPLVTRHTLSWVTDGPLTDGAGTPPRTCRLINPPLSIRSFGDGDVPRVSDCWRIVVIACYGISTPDDVRSYDLIYYPCITRKAFMNCGYDKASGRPYRFTHSISV